MGVPGTEFFIGVAIIVVGGLAVYVARRVTQYVVNAVAAALVKSINGQLGLDAVRRDVAEMKKHAATTAALDQKIANLEGQIAALHGD